MSKSIAVFGAGPGLGQAVARRYAREGYAVTLVARRPEPLDRLAKELTSAGATAHVVTADLADTGATPQLAEQIRAKAGNLDAFYYAPTPATGFVSAASLTPQHAQNFMPLIFYTMLALVQEFLPHMLEQGDGAILTAQGGSTVQGLPNMSGPSPAQAAQRNYLQALHAEVAEKGVYVGMLYIGAAIRNSAFHAEMEHGIAAGDWVWEMPTVDPGYLADLLWTMHGTRGQREATIRSIAGRGSVHEGLVAVFPAQTVLSRWGAPGRSRTCDPTALKISDWAALTPGLPQVNVNVAVSVSDRDLPLITVLSGTPRARPGRFTPVCLGGSEPSDGKPTRSAAFEHALASHHDRPSLLVRKVLGYGKPRQ